MRHLCVTRARFKEMVSTGLITDDATVAACTLLLLHEETANGSPGTAP